MKKIILLLMFFSLILSCSDDDKTAVPSLSITKEVVNFEAIASAENITVTTNVPEWTVEMETAVNWCTVAANKSTGNFVSVSVLPNDGMETRSVKIIIKAEDVSKTIIVNQLGQKPAILLDIETKEIDSKGIKLDIVVTSNIEYDVLFNVDWITPAPATMAMVEKKLSFVINENLIVASRKGTIEFKQKGGTITKTFTLTQGGIKLADETFKDDIKVAVDRAEVANGEFQPGAEIAKTLDGDYESMYHSRWSGATVFPVTLTYFFTGVDKIDYAKIHARPGTGGNGHFQKFDVYVKADGKAEYKLGSYDFNGTGGAQNVLLNNVENPEYVKYVVNSGLGDYVSCAEMEFFKYDPQNTASDIFSDLSCSALKANITLAQISGIESPLLKGIATQLYHKTYDTKYRAAKYKAIPSHSLIAAELKIGTGFSRYENMTGMYLEKGQAIIFVGSTGGKSINLILPDLMRQPTPGYDPDDDPRGWGLIAQRIPLKEGVNNINVEVSTNAYIDYYDNNPETAPEITVHFPIGKVNGYFDASIHTDKDWNSLLDNAVSPMMDAKGKYIQVAYPVQYFKQYTYGRGQELISNYDRMLLSHYTFMGLVKYNRMPKNRILSRVNFNYYMFRDGDGVAYMGNASTMRMVAEPSVVIQGDPCWGFCHEVGHVLQMRPQLNWGGLGEVSNNFFALYTTTALGNTSRIKAEKKYAKARLNIIDTKTSLLIAGNKENNGGLEDPFLTLVPFWQLHLYFSRNGKPEFYADLMEDLRNKPHAGTGNNAIKNQFEFMKVACDIGKTDLTEFFEKWGFFYVGSFVVEDYGTYNYTVTQVQVDEVKAYIAAKKYPQPSVDISTLED